MGVHPRAGGGLQGGGDAGGSAYPQGVAVTVAVSTRRYGYNIQGYHLFFFLNVVTCRPRRSRLRFCGKQRSANAPIVCTAAHFTFLAVLPTVLHIAHILPSHHGAGSDDS